MVDEPPTGVFFRSSLGTPEMAKRLRDGLPEFEWSLGDSDQYRYYHVRGKRPDGLRIKIEPEDAPDEYYLGVYFIGLGTVPDRTQQIAIAQRLHEQVLPLVEGVRRA
jgi:hypothetical protein